MSTVEFDRTPRFIMSKFDSEELVILTKTYPEPSTKYRETTCVAALTRSGEMRRVFPVPFRLLDGESRFRKWEWIRVSLKKASDDRRPESYKLDLDSGIERSGEIVDTKDGWRKRRALIESHIVESFCALEARRQATGQTLGILRPTRLLGLDIEAAATKDWTEKDLNNLSREGLFDDVKTARPLLKKLPAGFYYRYEIETAEGLEIKRHKITDWEAGALLWNCVQSHGSNWEEPFRQKLETEFAAKDLMFLMGTIHRFPDQWLIVGLIYPPKPPPQDQLSLL